MTRRAHSLATRTALAAASALLGTLHIAPPAAGEPFVVTHVAGAEPTLQPQQFKIAGLTKDGTGSLYVTDATNNVIWKATPGAGVTLFAGLPGVHGSADGTGADARFDGPSGLASDGAGDIYVADAANHTIRKMTLAGEVTTVAGLAGSPGSADGTGSDARFDEPYGIAVDGPGNVYVIERVSHRLRKLTPAGTVTTIADLTGVASSAPGLATEFGLAVDTAGTAYVVDPRSHTLHTVTPAGEITTLAGLAGSSGSADGSGSAARFYAPGGVAVDVGGDIYVTDAGNKRIRRVSPAGVVTTLAGGAPDWPECTDGTGAAACFIALGPIVVDGSGGVYVKDDTQEYIDGFTSVRIRRMSPAGEVTSHPELRITYGYADGVGNSAWFCRPIGVALDAAGNLYVAEHFNHVLRKVTPAGEATTLAGLAGDRGSTDGVGRDARFDFPGGVAVDGAGNVYVADFENHTVRKMTPAGQVTTLAGLAGQSGSADGAGSAARFYHPSGVAMDGAANVYVADNYNHTIRKVTPAGEVTTVAGLAGSPGSADGTGSDARFYYPSGLSADASGNLYVADQYNSTIRKVTPDGVVTTFAGLARSNGHVDGVGSAARLAYPLSTAVDAAGNVYVADTYTDTIRKITPSRVVTTLAGRAWSTGAKDAVGGDARFIRPAAVAVDASGTVYVADGANTIRRIAPTGEVATLAGRAETFGTTDGVGADARFNQPSGLIADGAGGFYVADSDNHVIRRVTPSGVVTTFVGEARSPGAADGLGGAARFDWPSGLAIDASANLYVADRSNNTIRKVTPAGAVTTLAGLAGNGNQGSTDGVGSAARFYYPSSVVLDGSGNLYVTDSYNHTIRKVTLAGQVTTFAGLAGSPGSTDGTGSAARFNYPSGLACDAAGSLYVADQRNATIRKLSPTGVVTTLAGLAGSFGSRDGLTSAARFSGPRGLTLDASGNLYVTDGLTIRRVTPAGEVTTLAGQPSAFGYRNGTGNAARFSGPAAIALDPLGDVYVADARNDAIRRAVPAGAPPRLVLSDATVVEGDAGGVSAVLTATLYPAAAAQVTATWATADGTAVAPADYTSSSGTLTFAPGVVSQPIVIPLVSDDTGEAAESFTVTLSDAVNAIIADGASVVTIVDDDPAGVAELKSATYTVTEAGPMAVILVTRAAVGASGLGGRATVAYATSDGTARAGSDYTATTGTLTFAPNQTEKTFMVPILADTLDEGHETVSIGLSSPGANTVLGARTTAVLTILDDERTVQFALAETRLSESAPQAVVTVKRSGLTTGGLTVDYVVSDGTAMAGADYRTVTGTLSFGAGVTSRTFAVPFISDTLDEPDETVLLRLRNPVGGSVGPLGTTVLTILDNDVAGTVQLTAAATSVLESAGVAQVKVSRSGGAASGVTVAYQTSDGTATGGSDYAPTAGVLTFAAGQTTQTIVIPIVNDTAQEGNETVNVTLTGVGGGGVLGTRAAGLLTIVDDEATVELGAVTYSVTEGGQAAVQVKRTGSLAGTVLVPYSTADETATGLDYTAKPGILTFGPGVATKPLPIPTINDTLDEENETFRVTLGTPTGGLLGGRASAEVTIVDNDAGGVLELSLTAITVLESAPTATITVKRTGGTAGGALVDFATGDDTATTPSDYGAFAGTLTFNAGQLSQTVRVPIVNDTEAENAETVLLTLSNARGGATLGPKATGVLAIQDNDGPYFAFAQPKYAVAETGRTLTLTAKRVGSVTGTATVGYHLVDGSATAASDYAAAAGTLTFASGQASKTFTVTINDDTLDEPAETFSAVLESPQAGYHLGSPSETVVTITDNDVAGTVRFGSAVSSTSEGEDGTYKWVSVVLTRSSWQSSGATVDYATSDGTATAGTDYDSAAGTMTFGAGQAIQALGVRVVGDGEDEGNESITLTLSNPGGGLTLGTPATTTLWITEPVLAAKLIVVGDALSEAWLSNEGGGLAQALRSHNYFVSATDAQWVTKTLGGPTALGAWSEWLRGSESETVLTALLAVHESGAGRFPRLPDPAPERPNEVVLLPSNLANARLADRAACSALLEVFAAHPETLFVIVTAPPPTAAQVASAACCGVSAFHTWLADEWLSGYAPRNVVVFDLFNVLTSNGGTHETSDAGLDTGSHHRIWQGAVQHVVQEGQDTSAYATASTNALPTAVGLRKATEELLPLLNLAVNRWKAERSATETPEAQKSPSVDPTPQLSPLDIAPPGAPSE